ncbi:MAG: T9SS type A sorting domain-containing protein [Bacteroidales bacterium]|nr:T9SS type A sorting domain-containing protein [Bacteroidales bacterium]
MKHFILVMLLSISASGMIKSQSIIAGQYSSNDHYVDRVPDKFVYCDNMFSGCDDFTFDLNGDGITDFVFYLDHSNGSNGSINEHIKIMPLNGNQVVFGRADSCEGYDQCAGMFWYYEIVENFILSDTIDASCDWNYGVLHLLSKEGVIFCLQPCFHIITQTSSPAILGTKIIVDSDTLYGWIRVHSLNSTAFDVGFKIDDYAWNKTSGTNISEEDQPKFSVYPNPCKDHIIINFQNDKPHGSLSILDLMGREVIKHLVKNKKEKICLNSFSRGLYFVKYTDGTYAWVEKIIIE